MLDLIMNINLLGGYVIEWNHAHSNVVSKTLHHQVIIDFCPNIMLYLLTSVF